MDEPRQGSWKQNGPWEGQISPQSSSSQLLDAAGMEWDPSRCSGARGGPKSASCPLLGLENAMENLKPTGNFGLGFPSTGASAGNPSGNVLQPEQGWNPRARNWTAVVLRA